jgi:hypothetical protein
MDSRRLARKTDPRTSVEAARKAAKASFLAVQAVERLMSDGCKRIDEEIWQGCREQGYISSLSTVQHGRLTLSEAGLLLDTGETRTTTDSAQSIVWGLNPNPPSFDSKPDQTVPTFKEASKAYKPAESLGALTSAELQQCLGPLRRLYSLLLAEKDPLAEEIKRLGQWIRTLSITPGE